MTGCADNQRFAILDRDRTNLVDRSGVAEIDRNVAILNCRLDRIAQISLRGDVDLWIAFSEIDNRLTHSTARTNQRHAH